MKKLNIEERVKNIEYYLKKNALERLPAFALKRKIIVLTAMGLMLLWGLWVFFTIPRNEDPIFHLRTCVVSVEWPGATAKKVEQLVTIPLEKTISSLDEVKRIRSESRVGLSVLYVDLEPRVKNIPNVWNKIRAKVNKIAPTLPEGTLPPQVDTEFGNVEAMVLALYPLYPKKYTYEDLRKYAKFIQTELNSIPMVGRILIMGTQPEVINLEVPSGIWSKLNLTVEELALALQERNIVAPGGSLDTKLGRFIVRLTGEFQTTKQIEQVILGALEKRAPTYLKDLGIKINRTYPYPPVFYCRYGEKNFIGEKCLIISFTMKKGGNIVKLGEEVRKKIKELTEKVLPKDIKISIVSDQPIQVERRIGEFTSNLIQGIVIVVLIGFLMVGFRVALIMATAIPLVLISSIGLMPIFGVELEQVSIAALIVALGMLVDNAIEVSDNVHRYLVEEKKGRFEAAERGASEIAIPILSATLTTVAAFLPMLTIPAEEGEFVYSLPVVVSITLLLSWFIAMTVTTILCYWFISPTTAKGGILAFINRFWIAMVAIFYRFRKKEPGKFKFAKKLFKWVIGEEAAPEKEEEEKENRIIKSYTKLLSFAIKHRGKTLLCGITLIAFCAILSGMVGDQFFPLAFRDQFVVDIWLPAGVPISRTDEVCRHVEKLIRNCSVTFIENKKVERLKNMVSFIGGGPPRFYITFDPQPEQHNFAQIIVNTTKPDYTDSFIKDLRKIIKLEIAGARVDVRKLNLGTLTGAPVAFRVIGKDVKKMRKLVKELKKFLFQQEEVLSIYDDWGNPIYQLEINVDGELANLAGVTNKNVAQTMNTFLSGQYLTTFREGDHKIPVFLILPKSQRDSLGPIHNFYVDGRLGRVPIDGISKINVVYADGLIARRNQELTITVYAYIREDALPNEVVRKIIPYIEEMRKKLEPGYRIEIGGEWEETKNSEKNFNYAFNISFILIILILVGQYNCLSKPIMILLTLPMAFAGSMFGLFITQWPLNFMALLGLVSLAGIVLNDAIVLIDFIDTELKNGLPIDEAIIKAGRLRMKPILLTSFTTAGGLVPLALWGGPMWEPMAYVIIFGLLTATFLTLILIPCVYYMLYKDAKIIGKI